MNSVTLPEIKTMAKKSRQILEQLASQNGRPVKIYAHWSAGHYQQTFPDYHFNITGDGVVYASVDDLSTVLSHTYHRNSGAVSVSLCCAYNAISAVNLGPEPPAGRQIEALAQVIAVLAGGLGLPIDIQHVMTHAEAADNMDGYDPGYEANGYPQGKYGPQNSVERWDLWVVREGDQPGTGGGIIRGKTVFYQQQGL